MVVLVSIVLAQLLLINLVFSIGPETSVPPADLTIEERMKYSVDVVYENVEIFTMLMLILFTGRLIDTMSSSP